MSIQDALIRVDGSGVYDLQLSDDGSDFASAGGFESAIPVSLFTDSRAPASTVAEPRNRRGWLGNLLRLGQNRELGGLLWLFEQGRITVDTLNGVKREVERSLRWMVQDGIVNNIAATVSVEDVRVIRVLITFTGNDNAVSQYSVLWRRTVSANLASR